MGKTQKVTDAQGLPIVTHSYPRFWIPRLRGNDGDLAKKRRRPRAGGDPEFSRRTR
ncbi:hypothetical protein GCM10017655_29750 [Pseudomonas turukhanskensis]|uniref:Uncharacterized protein n=1 Tax=Pseudomonas turukhanskensis TaxID=1806536 RepID=A0A9W6K7Z3_9PSED|nr:hypothetical protein GCM10017655_29750 [Pseudomonas turukhanskensis]